MKKILQYKIFINTQYIPNIKPRLSPVITLAEVDAMLILQSTLLTTTSFRHATVRVTLSHALRITAPATAPITISQSWLLLIVAVE